MFEEEPISMHILVAVGISIIAAIWAYYRLNSDSGPVIHTGDVNVLGDAEIVNNKTYI